MQDKSSFDLLQAYGITHASITGDSRFDRVEKIANAFEPITAIDQFLSGKKCIVAGSTWQEDEEILKESWTNIKHHNIKLIIAPHEIHQKHLDQIKNLFPEALFYSDIITNNRETNVLIIDNVGMLSRLYQYATITYVGGGFTKDGIHNILEAAVWAKPVVFGANYKKYREANELIEAGGAFSISNSGELKKLADELLNDEQYLQAVSNKAKKYVVENTGATQNTLQFIQEKRLLTN